MKVRSTAWNNVAAAVAIIGMAVAMANQACGADVTWDGSAGDGLWATVANWTPESLPGTTSNVVLSNGQTITGSLTTKVATIDSITGNGLGGTISAYLYVNNKVTNTAGTLVLNGSASSRYIGGATVNGGSLVFNNFSTQATATTYIASGANLTLNYDATTSAKTWGGTVAGQITGTGTLNTQGLVRLNSDSKLTFTGDTNVQSGCLYLGSGGTEGGVGGKINIASAARVELNTGTSVPARDQAIANDITSYGTLTKINPGTETLTGNSVFYGKTQVEGPLAIGGTLQLDIANSGLCANFEQYMRAPDGTHTDPWIQYVGDVTFNGALKLDVTDVTDLTGSWVLANADVAKHYGSGFTLAFSNGDLFTNNGNVWTGEYGGKSWSFNESNATLTVVPEPGAIILLISALLGLATYAWRRKS
jgi:autotransporter-associated beta strand protein